MRVGQRRFELPPLLVEILEALDRPGLDGEQAHLVIDVRPEREPLDLALRRVYQHVDLAEEHVADA